MFKIALGAFTIFYLIIFACVSSVIMGVYAIMGTTMEQMMITNAMRTATYATEGDTSTNNPMSASAVKRGDGAIYFRILGDVYSHHLKRTADAVYDWVSDSIDIKKYEEEDIFETGAGKSTAQSRSKIKLEICKEDDCEELDFEKKDVGMTYEDILYLKILYGEKEIPSILLDKEKSRGYLYRQKYLGKIMINGKEVDSFSLTDFMLFEAVPILDQLDYSMIKNKGYVVLKHQGRMTSEIGERFLYTRHWHPGIDISAPVDTPVFARFDGIVARVWRRHPVYGDAVLISNGEIAYMVAHLDISSSNIREGSFVKGIGPDGTGGDFLGRVALTGITTGGHIHIEVMVKTPNGWVHVNPCQFMDVCKK